MRNKFFTAALILSLPFFLSACTIQDLPLVGRFFGKSTGSGSTLNKYANISVWGMWESPEVIDSLVAKFNEVYPDIKITYEDRSVVKADQYKVNVLGRLPQEDVPDVVLIHNSWMPKISGNLSPAPKNVYDADTYRNDFYSVAYDSGVVNGSVYAVPVFYDGLVLLYNKDHFDQIDQQTPPTAWEEFRRLALKLTIREEKGDGIVRAGAAIGTSNNIMFASDILGLMFSQARVQVPESLDSRAAQDALSFYTAFVKEDKIWNETFDESLTAFVKGDVSMVFAPSWALLNVKMANTDLNIGVAPVPQAVADDPTNWGSFWMYAVPSNSDEATTAWEFIKFMTTQEQQLMLFDLASKQRLFGPIYSRVALADQLTQGPYAEFLSPFLRTAPTAKTSVLAGRSGNTKEETAIKDAINAVLSKEQNIRLDPAEALKTAKTQIMLE